MADNLPRLQAQRVRLISLLQGRCTQRKRTLLVTLLREVDAAIKESKAAA